MALRILINTGSSVGTDVGPAEDGKSVEYLGIDSREGTRCDL